MSPKYWPSDSLMKNSLDTSYVLAFRWRVALNSHPGFGWSEEKIEIDGSSLEAVVESQCGCVFWCHLDLKGPTLSTNEKWPFHVA